MLTRGNCAVCKGNGFISLLGSSPCSFCNGTGEDNKPAKAYLASHTCQCNLLDRKRCPICEKKCHHDTPNKPGILLSPE